MPRALSHQHDLPAFPPAHISALIPDLTPLKQVVTLYGGAPHTGEGCILSSKGREAERDLNGQASPGPLPARFLRLLMCSCPITPFTALHSSSNLAAEPQAQLFLVRQHFHETHECAFFLLTCPSCLLCRAPPGDAKRAGKVFSPPL